MVIGTGATLLGGVVLAFGGYRFFSFIDGIRRYREQTKAEWLAVPHSMLQLAGRRSVSDLRFFRINDSLPKFDVQHLVAVFEPLNRVRIDQTCQIEGD